MKKRFDDDMDILPFGEDIPETGFENLEQEEDPESEDEKETLDEKNKDTVKKEAMSIIRTSFKAAVLFTAGLMLGTMIYDSDPDTIPDRESSHTENTTSVAGRTEEITEEQTEGAAHSSSPSGENMEDWKNTVFGSKNENTVFSRIRVSGLSSEDIAGSGFSETAFVKAAGSFLKEQGINTKEIRFKDKAIASPDCSFSWSAEIAGNKEKDLIVMWYPDYPGRYILTILDKDNSSEIAEDLSGAGNAGNVRIENTAANSPTSQMQNVQNTDQTTVRQAEPSYDATRLSIRNIPQTLLNYISNRYDFQYSLYDYLYQKGSRDIESASVTGYEIDPDRREASIELSISDGSHVTGTYRMSDHSFSYRMS